MTPTNTFELLSLWERAVVSAPARRPLTFLGGEGRNGEVPVGVCNANLLSLRESLFGKRLASLTDCPSCGERIAFEFAAADVLAGTEPPHALIGTCDGYTLRFRVPHVADLAALAGERDTGRRLFERCLHEARFGDYLVPAADVPDAVVRWAAARMAEADPDAVVWLKLNCPACGAEWQAAFDVATYFWTELDYWARRLLDEVHMLASAYGWREAEILTLSSARRQYYLERVGG
jgi:hypothetical protein